MLYNRIKKYTSQGCEVYFLLLFLYSRFALAVDGVKTKAAQDPDCPLYVLVGRLGVGQGAGKSECLVARG